MVNYIFEALRKEKAPNSVNHEDDDANPSHTNELSLPLQKKDQNIVQAMYLVVDVRICLNDLRSEGWDPLFEEVKVFCVQVGIDIPDTHGPIPRFGHSRRGGRNNITQDFTVLISSMLLLTLL
jgi:hypothetical protein